MFTLLRHDLSDLALCDYRLLFLKASTKRTSYITDNYETMIVIRDLFILHFICLIQICNWNKFTANLPPSMHFVA